MGIFSKKKKQNKEGRELQIIAAGREPIMVEHNPNYTVEDYLIEAGIDADKVTIDNKEVKLNSKLPSGTQKLVVVPNVKGGYGQESK